MDVHTKQNISTMWLHIFTRNAGNESTITASLLSVDVTRNGLRVVVSP